MLDVTLDLITQTASSSLFAFCFCNLIIVIILVGSKPGSEFEHEEKNSPLLEASNTSTDDDHQEEEEIKNPKHFCEDRDDLQVVTEVESPERLLVVEEKNVSESEDEEGEEEEDDNDGDGDDDDEQLRKRFEEFIQKVNRGWKAELSKNSNLIEV